MITASTLLKQKNAEALATGQTDEFTSQVLNSSNQNSDEEQVPRELTEHLCAFKQSDSFGKTVILFLIDHKKIHYWFHSKYFQLPKIFSKDYLFTSGLMQDVAYDIAKLKFDSGGTKTILHAVLTA